MNFLSFGNFDLLLNDYLKGDTYANCHWKMGDISLKRKQCLLYIKCQGVRVRRRHVNLVNSGSNTLNVLYYMARINDVIVKPMQVVHICKTLCKQLYRV